MSYKKKLIEVALPLDAINKASLQEESIWTAARAGLIWGVLYDSQT
ncbi:hypothetical protein SBDP1_830027 [Syntrophobacter sp. SbD1]|nr:hypothetical protein SBDP1_830027 [Syntrophobacter sp. SbD1]